MRKGRDLSYNNSTLEWTEYERSQNWIIGELRFLPENIYPRKFDTLGVNIVNCHIKVTNFYLDTMSTISCILHALIGSSLAVNFQQRSIQLDENVVQWQYDADDISENGKIEFQIRTKMNQFSFGWNRDETLGGDLVFLDIVEASENASSMDNSQAGF